MNKIMVNSGEIERNEVISLILKARKNGSQDAFNDLRERYAPLIESQVTKHKLHYMSVQDVEDLRQEAVITFCNAVCNYDCDSVDVEFGLYAKICIQNRLISFIRSYVSRKKVLSLDEVIFVNKSADSVDFLQMLVNKERTVELFGLIGKNLSEYENKIWWLYVSGMTVSDIADTIGDTNAKSVSNAVYRIRKKLRAFFSDEKQF